MVILGRWEVELGQDAADVLAHGRLGDDEGARYCGIGATLRHEGKHLEFASGQPGQRIPAPPQQLADDLGVDHRGTVGHPNQRVGELLDVADAVLEQVAGQPDSGPADPPSIRFRWHHGRVVIEASLIARNDTRTTSMSVREDPVVQIAPVQTR